MLDALRNAARSWVAKSLLILLGLSFVAWGVGDVFRAGFVGNSIISSGSTIVSPIEYRLAYNRQIQVYGQQLNQRLSREQALALGIDKQVLAQLTAGVVLDEQSRKMNLGLSEERLASLTAEDPAFRDASGKFSRTNFDAVLRTVGMRAEDYLKSREQVAIRQQVVEALADGVAVPNVYLEAMSVHEGESRDVDYVRLPVSLVQPVKEPVEAELSKFYDERKDSYKAPEYRKFSYVRLAPEDIANPAAVDDAMAKAEYDKNIERYTKKETRRIDQIVFVTRDAAVAAKAKITAGTLFDDIVKSENKTAADVSLGDLQKTDLPDPKIADAAFSLAAGQVSDVIDGQFGAVIVRVSNITPQTVESYEAVKEDIRKNIALNEANDVLLETHDAYEDARGGGDSMEVAALKAKLKPVVVEASDSTGRSMDGKQIADLPESANLLAAVFAAEQGIENAPLNVGSNGFLWYEVQGVTPERERPLSEIKDKVVADWKAAKASELLAAKAAEVSKSVSGGRTLDDIATELKLTKDTKRGLKRNVEDPDFDDATVEAAFGGGEGFVTVASGGSGDTQVVMKVVETYEPTDKSAAAVAEDLKKRSNAAMSDDLLDQLVAKLQTEFPVTVNKALIERAIAN
jgi:peptidyl-prolyl cis-trans isomerase D